MIDGSKTNEETEELRKIEQAYIIAQIRPLQVFHFSPTSYRSVKQSYCNHETKLLDDFVDSVNNILSNLQEQHNATPLGDHLRSGQYCPPLTTSELFISTNETAGEENKDTLSVTFREQRRATAVHKELLRSSDSFTRNNSSFPFTPIPVQNPPKPEQMNMDDDLWMKVCANFNDEAESSLFYLRLNTREKIIAYLKSHVTGINAFHGEQASVFMTLVVKLYRLHCSRSSIKKLLSPKSHPVVCAAAMVLMRFTQSPEEVLWLFQNAGLLDLPSAKSMFNENQPVSEVAVMPSSIGQHEEMSERKELDALIPVTNTSVIHLGELARRLLLEDEVLEAWFPIYPPHVLVTLRDSVNGHCEAVSSICKHSSSSKTKSRATTFTTLFGPFEDLPTLVRHLNQTASTFAPSEDGSYEMTNEEALQKQHALGGHSRKRSGTSNTFRDHKNMKAKEDGHSKGLKTDSSTSKYQNAANIPQHPTSLKRRRPVNTAPYLS